MLLNLSNHPSNEWSPYQKETAEQKFREISDLLFPSIEPSTSTGEVFRMAKNYAEKCLEILHFAEPADHAVHVMGELTFTHALVNELQKAGICCVASTTRRIVSKDQNGGKMSYFEFAGFREYFNSFS